MSFFSRLFRKAPSPAAKTAAAPIAAAKVGAAAAKPAAVERASAVAAEEQALQVAIASGDAPAIARLVASGTTTKIRQAAAQAVEDAELLRQLIRDLRGGNDKTAYKILTTKRDAQLEQARQQEQLQAEIAAATLALERHSKRPFDIGFTPLLTQLENAWQALAAQANAEQRATATQWIERARSVIAEQQRLAEARATEVQAAAAAAAARQQQAEAAAAAAAEQARAAAEQQRVVTEQAQAEQQVHKQIADLIRKARMALSDGSTARAAGVRRTIAEKLPNLPPLPPHLASQLQQLDAQLDNLKGWKSFSVTPKRAELIEEMERLVGADYEPLDLADRIKRLQEEWRSLSRGAGESESDEADWQRFHDAAQKAYLPCQEYFAAQARVLEENLKRREGLIAHLQAFEAATPWERADWRGVIATLRETKEQWRAITPVDRRAGKAQQEQFSALVAGLQARVEAEHAKNQQQKEALIERAQALAGAADLRAAIDAVKKLQQEWQATGTVPREVDQRLWGEFRQRCDAVFQRREQESAAQATALQASKAQAIALCEQVEALATLEGADLLEAVAGLPELRTAFDAVGELPRADARALQERFERGLGRCKDAVRRQQAADAERAWVDMFAVGERVRAYRFAQAVSTDEANGAGLKAEAEAAIAAVPRWPKGGLEAIQQALANTNGAQDLAANEQALRTLCIRAELLTDQTTPPEDQALRREYQLQRLVQSLGQGVKEGAAQLDQMALDWLRVGPIAAETYQALLQRFLGCRVPRASKPA